MIRKFLGVGAIDVPKILGLVEKNWLTTTVSKLKTLIGRVVAWTSLTGIILTVIIVTVVLLKIELRKMGLTSGICGNTKFWGRGAVENEGDLLGCGKRWETKHGLVWWLVIKVVAWGPECWSKDFWSK